MLQFSIRRTGPCYIYLYAFPQGSRRSRDESSVYEEIRPGI